MKIDPEIAFMAGILTACLTLFAMPLLEKKEAQPKSDYRLDPPVINASPNYQLPKTPTNGTYTGL